MREFLTDLLAPLIRLGSSSGPTITSGLGTPEGVVTAPIGSIFCRTDGSTGTALYRKESGVGNTGWVAVSAPGAGSGDVVGPASSTDNALARFDLATGKLIQNSPVLLDDAGALTIPAISTPAAPASGMIFFARDLAGRVMPFIRGVNGDTVLMQQSIGRSKVSFWSASGGGTNAPAVTGLVMSTIGAATASNWSTGVWGAIRKLEYLVTTPATTAVAGIRSQSNQFTVGGAAARIGGFHATFIWGPATGVATATTRAFVGMRPTGAPTDVEPSTLINMVGMGWDAADTNVQFMYNDGSGVATKVDLGASFPVPTVDRTTMYRLTLFSPPGTTQVVGYLVEDLTTDVSASGSVNTNLPSTATAIAPTLQISVGGTSSVIGLAISQVTVETDL